MRKLCLLALMLVSTLMAHADEGMWTLHDLDKRTVAVMQKLGLQLSASELYTPGQRGSLKDAVVLFGGYCSGVIVSDQGLVFTNHHCGYRSIQVLSSPGEDLLKDGFVAQTQSAERRAPGLFVAFLDSVIDVTSEVLALVDETTDINAACNKVEERYNNQGNYRELKSYYGGTKFFLSVYRKYDDVRLVFTIPESLGKFGGDTDNWMWPRQTCDFSVFRVYADKDGNPAAYSPDNVPLHTPHHAEVSLEGQQEGGYCMTMGYPGSTERYLSSYGITSMMKTGNHARANVRGELLRVWRAHMAADRTVGIKYSSKAASSSNYWKNSIGMNKALKTLKVEKEKRKLEGRINKWIKADNKRMSRFGGVTKRLKKNYSDVYNNMFAMHYLFETYRGIDCYPILRLTETIATASDSARRATAIEQREKLLKDYDLATDREAIGALLTYLRRSLNKKYLPKSLIEAKDGRTLANYLFDNTRLLCDDATTLSKEEVSKDTLLNFCKDFTNNFTKWNKSLTQTKEIQKDEQLLTQAFLEMHTDEPHYSDANMTMRVSFGSVQPYDNTEGTHYDCFTYPASLLEKANNGNPDYVLQSELVSLMKSGDFGRYADKQGNLPLCFLTTNDITGGNSGSPMFDGKGRLLGLAFDGNWDALSSDVKFNTAMTRCIGVDVRYIMFLIDKWGKADRLVREVLD